MIKYVDPETPILFLCSDMQQASYILSLLSDIEFSYVMVGSPVVAEDLRRAGIHKARRFICFSDEQMVSSNLERYVVDFTSLSAHIATCNVLQGDSMADSWNMVSEKLLLEFVFNQNAELLLPQVKSFRVIVDLDLDLDLLLPQVKYVGDDPDMINIVSVHDHQCAPFVASGTVISPSMIDFLMFQTYYSCYTLGVITNMANGQLQLIHVPECLVGATFFELTALLTSLDEPELIMVPIALLRPAGHLESELRYIYTMPKVDTVLVKGDRVYVLNRSPVLDDWMRSLRDSQDSLRVEELEELLEEIEMEGARMGIK